MKNTVPAASIRVRTKKKQGRFKRIRVPNGPDMGHGEFFFLIEIEAVGGDVYIPLSIASGKKPTGFIYQIEGTAAGTIATTNISCSGTGITQVTLGTLLYAKIPSGKMATFRILVEMRGKIGKEYQVTISWIHYKRSPSDARYQKSPQEIGTGTVKFD